VKIDRESVDPSSFHRFHRKDCASSNDAISGLWQATKNSENESADRSGVFVWNLQSEALVQFADVRAS
jgi:hypothetical protein